MKPIVLITGGSRGIGAATALRAASLGFAVAVNYAANKGAADAVVVGADAVWPDGSVVNKVGTHPLALAARAAADCGACRHGSPDSDRSDSTPPVRAARSVACESAGAVQAAMAGGGSGYYASLTRSLSLVLDEFYNHLHKVGVSAATGDGVDDFWDVVQKAALDYEEGYLVDLKCRMEEQLAKERAIKRVSARRLARDLEEDNNK